MRREERQLNVPASVGPGEPTRCDTWIDKWAEVDGAFTGSASIEGRLSAKSTSWVEVDTATGGVDTLIEVKPLFYEVRLNTALVTGGAPSAKLVGMDARTT